jgi:REP-associated tyrosine transposase
MSRPRQVLKNEFHMITRRCTQRQFLLRPDETTNEAFTYCLAEAAQRFDIDVVLSMAESNHHHTIIFDREGNFPAFTEHFHKMVARCMNARWGRWENFWASEEVCVTRLLTRETVMEKLTYVATNPVKDFLVDEARQWPGTNGYVHLLQRKPLRACRPKHFFRDYGVMPEEVTLALVIPPELGDADSVIEDLRARVTAVEEATRAHRLATGRRVLGRKRVTQQSWRGSPDSVEPRRTLRPRFAGPVAERVSALLSYREFLSTYDLAREQWRAGRTARFPLGTYWLARFAPILVAP